MNQSTKQSQTDLSWAAEQGYVAEQIDRLQPDASSRRYARLHTTSGSIILMNSENDRQSFLDFIAFRDYFDALGVRTPQVHAKNSHNSWLLCEDFGTKRLLETLINTPSAADFWYQKGIDIILQIQKASTGPHPDWPRMTRQSITKESTLALTHCVGALPMQAQHAIDQEGIQEEIQQLASRILSQPYAFSHRDFHAGNLMCLPNEQLGVLDFQSAFWAPMTYDAISLLRDCYLFWPHEQVTAWFSLIWKQSSKIQIAFPNLSDWLTGLDDMSLQRHLKCVGQFCLLSQKGATQFCSAIPRTLTYIQHVCQKQSCFPAIAQFADIAQAHFS